MIDKEIVNNNLDDENDSTFNHCRVVLNDLVTNVNDVSQWSKWNSIPINYRLAALGSFFNKIDDERKLVYPSSQLFVNRKEIVETVEGFLVDAFCPIPKGGRVNIFAQPQSGKTTFVENLLKSFIQQMENGFGVDEIYYIICDNRPEDTIGFGQKYGSDKIHFVYCNIVMFDPLICESLMEKFYLALSEAQIKALGGKDILFIIDSASYFFDLVNRISKGRISNGNFRLDALLKIEEILGDGCNIEGAGSLTTLFTIVDSPLNDSSKFLMQEARHWGDCEIYLSHYLFSQNVFPAINLGLSKKNKERVSRTNGRVKSRLLNRSEMYDANATQWLDKYGPIDVIEMVRKKMDNKDTEILSVSNSKILDFIKKIFN
ncbi:MAG: hypothetical protein MJZ66_07205 [Bacteroidales bacterium]|nr:hypothetical protein [Bacteroidales bacterium]